MESVSIILHDVLPCVFEVSTQLDTSISYDVYNQIIGYCFANGQMCPEVELFADALDSNNVPIAKYVGTVSCDFKLKDFSHSPLELEMVITNEPTSKIGLLLWQYLLTEATTPPTDDQQSTILE